KTGKLLIAAPQKASLDCSLPAGDLNALRWSSDGARLAAATTTGVYVYEVGSSCRQVASISTVVDGAALAWNPRGAALAMGTAEGAVMTWSVDRPSPLHQDLPAGSPLPVLIAGALAWDHDGGHLEGFVPDAPRIATWEPEHPDSIRWRSIAPEVR